MNEPLMRIGIVLKEDNKKEIIFNLPSDNDFKLYSDDGRVISLENNIDYIIKMGDKLILDNGDESIELSKRIKIKPERKYDTIHAKTGIRVNKIVTGRKFHWQKEISQYLMGSLEFTMQDNLLVMVNEILLEEYLMCVATSEMSSQCPEELSKAQTIAARSWIMARTEKKHEAEGFDACNDDCCQRYHGSGQLTESSVNAVMSTRGQVLLYDGKICDARYSKSCGGFTEKYENVWTGEPLPYLTSFFDGEDTNYKPLNDEAAFIHFFNSDPVTFCSQHAIKEAELTQYLGYVDEKGKYYRWEISYKREELEAILKHKLKITDMKCLKDIKCGRRGDSGRLMDVTLEYSTMDDKVETIVLKSEYKIREALHTSFMFSSAFFIEQQRDEAGNIISLNFKGAGWGHGAGLCQIGALGMALKGYKSAQIVAHYYRGSELKAIF